MPGSTTPPPCRCSDKLTTSTPKGDCAAVATNPAPAYAELRCLSSIGFQRGASQPEELAERAAALGHSALAITDKCSVDGVARAHGEAGRQSDCAMVDGVFEEVLDDHWTSSILPFVTGKLRCPGARH